MDADIDLFVAEKATGSARPVSIPYINFYHPTDSHGGTGMGQRWDTLIGECTYSM